MMFVTFNCNTAGVTSVVGTPFSSGTPEFIHFFCGVPAAQSLVFCVMLRRSFYLSFALFRCIYDF